MSSEYVGKRDPNNPILPILPRPLVDVHVRIRALNLTGDADGMLPDDDRTFWNGLDYRETATWDAADQARQAAWQADDWYGG